MPKTRPVTRESRKAKPITGNDGDASMGTKFALGKARVSRMRVSQPATSNPATPPIMASRAHSADPAKHVHWDLWLGVAPERPYDPIYHPFSWRGWLDFGTGAIGDMACHTANMAYRRSSSACRRTSRPRPAA